MIHCWAHISLHVGSHLQLLLQSPGHPEVPLQPKTTLPPPTSGSQQTFQGRALSGSLSDAPVSPSAIFHICRQTQPHPQKLQRSQTPALGVTHTAGGSPSPPTESSFLGSWGQRTPKELRAWQRLSPNFFIFFLPLTLLHLWPG